MLSFPFSKVHLVRSAQIRLNSELREDNAPSSTTTVETAVMCSNLYGNSASFRTLFTDV